MTEPPHPLPVLECLLGGQREVIMNGRVVEIELR
jgi:hypothetical protein